MQAVALSEESRSDVENNKKPTHGVKMAGKELLGDYSDEDNFATGADRDDSTGKGKNKLCGRFQCSRMYDFFVLTAYMVGWSAVWSCLLVVVVPRQIESIVGGKEKGTALGIVVAVGGLNSVIVPPVAGWLSDRTNTRWGRRRPYIVCGTIGCAICLLILPMCTSLGGFAFVWFLTQTASNFGSSAFLGLLPDTVPAAELGDASGIMAVSTALGQVLGAVAGLSRNTIGLFGAYCMLAVIHIFFMCITVAYVEEPANEGAGAGDLPTNGGEGGFTRIDGNGGEGGSGGSSETLADFVKDIIRPFRSNDFRWVYITRLFVQMGIYSVQEYMNYFVSDIITPGNHKGATAVTSELLATIVVAGGISGFLCGKLSDRIGGKRKIFVYVAGFMMSVSTFFLIWSTSFFACIVVALFFGAGFGAFAAVDMAMVVEALPLPEKAAQDMGVWHTSLVVPQMIATPIAGRVLDTIKKNSGAHDAYAAVFGMAVVYFALGTIFVSRLKKIK